MFCPKCKAEYRDGIYRCSDCEVDLIHQLPEEPEQNKEIKFVEVLSTIMLSDNAVIKSLSDAEGIRYYLQGDIGYNYCAGIPASRLLVLEEDVEKAKDLLKYFIEP